MSISIRIGAVKASITAAKAPSARKPSHQHMSEAKQTILFVQLAYNQEDIWR
jgi:hypothetical protein